MGNIIAEKSYKFAVRIVKLCGILEAGKKQFVLSTQLLKSGTSIGANVSEAQQAQSKKDFVSKISIALKEAAETKYWLNLLHDTGFLSDSEFDSIYSDAVEIEKILVTIIKTSKTELEQL
ncbi:MAG: four helix bundle protein [Eubacterium sp.]|nr:four helix bundle protein [Eubacterium sp.]MBR4241034.1 four helix bundle protein [Eubacterium sp.]MBR7060668.1 four helix bundle protein [Eubacterium sp.]